MPVHILLHFVTVYSMLIISRYCVHTLVWSLLISFVLIYMCAFVVYYTAGTAKFETVYNLSGGINLYASQVDPSIPLY